MDAGAPGDSRPGAEIITSEFDRWQTSAGDPVLDRLDILAVDPTGRIVVAELKRGIAPHTVHMQALNYAAMVSRLTPQDIAELYSVTRSRGGQDVDADSALTILTTEKLLTAESIRSPRIVLVASDFPPPVTATVVWLNEQGADISLIASAHTGSATGSWWCPSAGSSPYPMLKSSRSAGGPTRPLQK
jgi:hypothetical protein